MNKIFRSAAMLCGSIALLPSSVGAEQLRANHLPDGSQFPKAPLKVQILDTRPQVTDCRRPEENTVYNIQVGPMPQSITQSVQMIAPSPAGVSVNPFWSAPGTISIGQNHLPKSGFGGSNIGKSVAPGNLQAGTTTNSLMGWMLGMPKPVAVVGHAVPPQAQSAPVSVSRILEYAPQVSKGSSGNIVKTQVSGRLGLLTK